MSLGNCHERALDYTYDRRFIRELLYVVLPEMTVPSII
jgi:hypothetical protein